MNFWLKLFTLFECADSNEDQTKQSSVHSPHYKSTDHSDNSNSNSTSSSRSPLIRSPKSSSATNCFFGFCVHEQIDELQRILKESIAKVSPKSRKRGLQSKRSIEAKSSMERRCNGHLCELCEEIPCRDDCVIYFFEPLPPPYSINSNSTKHF